ncbi:MAG: radical SAM protein [Eubacteriales bacterium]
MNNLKRFASQVAVSKTIDYVDKNPKDNMDKILNLSEKILSNPRDKRVLKKLKKELKNSDSPWTKLVYKFFDEIKVDAQKKFIKNFFLNASIFGLPQEKSIAKKEDINVPWTILMDPTSSCNLKCTGCWANEYNKTDNLSYETMNRIIEEGKEIGIYMYIFSGGEPFVRIDDILKLCETHQDCYFTCFTNGTLITKDIAKRIGKVGNFAPAISIEGFEEATDYRRGKGTFKRLSNGMDYLKEEGVLYGVSVCYHHHNYKEIGSEEFYDFVIDKGAYFMWLFTYMPIGKDADTELCCKAEEREYMYHKVREYRETKPIFAMDFWNDGEYVDGCIAGGRNYFHINANGDVEPCAFVHYSDTNIKDVSLLEALKSPLFKAYKKRQPFNCNHLRPCPILDNPDQIVEIVNEAKAKSTQPLDKEPPEDLLIKCEPIAQKWGETADKLWVEDTYKNNNKKGA